MSGELPLPWGPADWIGLLTGDGLPTILTISTLGCMHWADVQVAFNAVPNEGAHVVWNSCGTSVNIRSVFSGVLGVGGVPGVDAGLGVGAGGLTVSVSK